jgi:hypothetical protein
MLNKVLKHCGLTAAKTRLAFDIKDPGYIGTRPGFDLSIGVDKGAIQQIRQMPAHRRLTRAHRANQK